MILHIPHSSTNLTDESVYLLDEYTLKQEVFNSTDWFTNELFSHPLSARCVFNISRLYIDVERFDDDREYYNNSIGRGIVYTKTLNNKQLKNKTNYNISSYYEHHNKLTNLIEESLSLFDKTVIVDCHSFDSNSSYISTNQNIPDICIGFNNTNIDNKLINTIKEIFEENNYSVAFNYPYQGSICPDKFTNNEDVISIMIEVNKDTYMYNDNYTAIKSENFDNIKNTILLVLDLISDYEYNLTISS